MAKPTGATWEHDGCDACVFLGPFGDESALIADLWFCPQGGLPTVMARIGDEPENYASGMSAADAGLPWAVEARKRAVRRGLLEPVGGDGQ